ncbi:type VI secretion protein ImpA [Burkholderia vietnamiensis]|uniref:type VI secretion system protein TssA n=1 Tax=Burkholderia vietnamiensis TaxID=60552 RepID=UPI000751F48E|nr:type VI secretion system ImpA family N-terminal domain-containing protein [Burkholderia vietnamiensis]KVE33601.1 type VI secretion protein ImpA [Burkholderia vietnamiensis]
MSKKQASMPAKSGHVAVKGTSHLDWLTPVSDGAPCGPDLEYDHDFVVLFAGAAPRPDVQYGTFVGAADPLNWSEIERDCRRLMLRTKDMRVAVLYTRCRTRLGGAVGLAEGTRLLMTWLQAFPDNIHPQVGADGEDRDAALDMRMNALQGLADPEGMLADVREIVLVKSTATRLQVRDVERAFAHPRPADAIAPDSVAQQLQDLRRQQPATMKAFDETISNLVAINMWCGAHLATYLPDFSSLMRLLQLLQQGDPHIATASNETTLIDAAASDGGMENGPRVEESDSAFPSDERIDSVDRSTGTSHADLPADRQAALALICAARQWFETHEPSSPIPVLLKRAEQFVGKHYAEVVRAIPAELLAQWEESDTV